MYSLGVTMFILVIFTYLVILSTKLLLYWSSQGKKMCWYFYSTLLQDTFRKSQSIIHFSQRCSTAVHSNLNGFFMRSSIEYHLMICRSSLLTLYVNTEATLQFIFSLVIAIGSVQISTLFGSLWSEYNRCSVTWSQHNSQVINAQ